MRNRLSSLLAAGALTQPLILIWLLALSGAAQSMPLVLADGQQSGSLSGHLHWYRDISGTLGIEDIIKQDHAGQFTRAADFPSFGYTSDVIWIRFSLLNSSQHRGLWLLSIAPSFIDHVQLFQLGAEQIDDLGTQGDRAPWSQRAVPWRNAIYALELPADQRSTYYLRLKSSSSIAISASLQKSSAVISKAAEEMLLFGLLLAAGVMMVALSLLFFTLLREPIYFYFMLYALSLTFIVVQLEGVIHFIVKPASPLHLEWLQVISQATALISMTLLLCEILNLRQQQPRLNRLITRIIIIIATAGCIPMLFGNYSLSISFLWLAIGLTNIIIPTVTLLLRRQIGRIAWLYTAAFAVIGSTALIRLGWVFGLSSQNRISEVIFPVIILLHVAVLFITMATRYVQLDRSMRRATQQALTDVENSGKDLQTLVDQRTMELDIANRNLANQLDVSQKNSIMLEKARDRLGIALEAEKHASLEQRRFLRMVAHEFRTPLSVIDLSAEMISADPRTPDVHATTNCSRIQQASQRMAALINQALREDKLDSAQWRKNSAFIQVSELLESAIHYGKMISAERHNLQLSCDADLVIRGDHDLLLTMINNIIDNAVKYSPEGSVIDVSATNLSDGDISIVIADHGRGMNEDELRQVLEKYFRAEAALDVPGMGLGMYLVDRIVRLHDATLHIESTPGAGTRFTIVFPSFSEIRETGK